MTTMRVYIQAIWADLKSYRSLYESDASLYTSYMSLYISCMNLYRRYVTLCRSRTELYKSCMSLYKSLYESIMFFLNLQENLLSLCKWLNQSV